MATAQVLITIKKSRHKSQPYTYTIDKPGGAPLETAAERYATKRNAIKGALRRLGAYNPTTVGAAKWTSPKGKVYPINIAEA